MDNAQSFNIPLDSPLEASIEHAMVPASRPTFAYNPQSPVSGLLHNSVKYEGRGIFCDKYRYDIGIKTTYWIQDSGVSSGVYVYWDENNPDSNRKAWMSLDQSDNPSPSLAQQPHPDDIQRNFYDYNGLRYAIDVKYPFTVNLRNLGFVWGYLTDGFDGAYQLPGAIGNGLKVIRTSYDDVDAPDKYIVSGATDQKNLAFKLSIDVYGRELDSYMYSNYVSADYVIPYNYVADVTFNRDEISVSVVHETKEQDNIVLTMPTILRNDTGWPMELMAIDYDSKYRWPNSNRYGRTRFDFSTETDVNRYIDQDQTNDALTMGSSLSRLSSTLRGIENRGTPSEQLMYGVVNTADIDWQSIQGGLEIELEVDRAHVMVVNRGVYTYSIGKSNVIRENQEALEMILQPIGPWSGGRDTRTSPVGTSYDSTTTPNFQVMLTVGDYTARQSVTVPNFVNAGEFYEHMVALMGGFSASQFIVPFYGLPLTSKADGTPRYLGTAQAALDIVRLHRTTQSSSSLISKIRQFWDSAEDSDGTFVKGHIPIARDMVSWENANLSELLFLVVYETDADGGTLLPGRSGYQEELGRAIEAQLAELNWQVIYDIHGVSQAVRLQDVTVSVIFYGVEREIRYIGLDTVIHEVTVPDLTQGPFQQYHNATSGSDHEGWVSMGVGGGSIGLIGVRATVTGAAVSVTDRSTITLSVSCLDVETGDWTAVVTSMAQGTRPLQVKGVDIDDGLKSGTIRLTIGASQDLGDGTDPVALAKTYLDSPKKDQEVGITFTYDTFSVLYAKNIIFKQSKKDTITVYQGEYPLRCRLELITPWDIATCAGLGEDGNFVGPEVGFILRQIVDLVIEGLGSNEVARLRQVLTLSPNVDWDAWTMSGENTMVLNGGQQFNTRFSWSVLNVSYPYLLLNSVAPVTVSGTPFLLEYLDPQRIIRAGIEPTLKKPGLYIYPAFRDGSTRYLDLRKTNFISANGLVEDYELLTAKGPTEDIKLLFRPKGWYQGLPFQDLVLRYNEGEIDFVPEESRPDLELSSVNSFSRILQFNDGVWSSQPYGGNNPGREFLSPTEEWIIDQQLLALGTDEDYDADVVEAWSRLLDMVYMNTPTNTISTFINQSVIANRWSDIYYRLTTYETNTLFRNIDIYDDTYRLIFRPSDKVEFQFLPQGIYQRTNTDINYISQRQVEDGIFIGHEVAFKYNQRNSDYNQEARVIVWEDERPGIPNAFANEIAHTPGKAYINVEAHDIEAGTMTQLEAANPDIDFAIITQQFDTDLDTEAMYYLNQDTIIKVTSSEFILLHKDDLATTERDNVIPDYDRRDWLRVASVKRNQLLGDSEEIIQFGVSSAEEIVPYFYVIRPDGNGINIRFWNLDLFDLRFEWDYNEKQYYLWNAEHAQKLAAVRYFDQLGSGYGYRVGFNRLDLGGFSSSNFAFMNEPPAAAHFVSSIKVTATRIKNYLLLGMVYDSGIHQWTVYMNPQRRRVFSGYGCVGIDGTLTGGAIPMYAMNRTTGLRVSVRDKPGVKKEDFINSRYMAFITGQSLVFIDPDFKNGICTSVKFSGSSFILRSIPLRFSRRALEVQDGATGREGYTGIVYLPPVNIGAITTSTSWTWATALAGIVINSWTVDSLTEDEDFVKIDIEEGQTPQEAGNTLLQVASALATTAVSIGNAINEKAVSIVNTLSEKQSIDWTRKLRKTEQTQAQVEAEQDRYNVLDNQFERDVSDYNATSGSRFYRDSVLDSLDTAFAVSTGLSVKPKSVAIAKARLGMSALYSISANSNIYSGPGFTQIHFVEGSRISGSYGWAHQADGKGMMIIPRVPAIPIPFIGPLDLNNSNVVGVNPIDGPHTADIGLVYQPNFNLGAKHLVYSYPILDMQEHVIRQSRIFPVMEYKEQELYQADGTFRVPVLKLWGFNRRIYYKQILKWQPETLETRLYENSSIVQGVDRIFSDDEPFDTPIQRDHGYPVYATPGAFDYCVYPSSELYYTAIGESVVAVSVRDTKILDGEPTNVVIQNKKPLVASSYACIEVTNVINEDTIRPTVYSGDTLVLNTTGYNTIKGLQVLHGFDGYSNRIAQLTGESGIDVEDNNQIYTHVESGVVKTTSLYPPTTYLGRFAEVPRFDSYLHPIKVYADYIGNMGQAHENLDGYRYSLPIVHKNLSLLPAVVQTIAPYKAVVIDGVTSQVTSIRAMAARQKAYAAYDFAIYGQPYRVNAEYIARLSGAVGAVALQDVVATLGLRYLGATPRVAWFYAPSTNTFFTFTGSETIDKAASAFRLREAQTGTWDYVSQEVAFKALLERDVEVRRHAYKDIIRVSDGFVGLVYPPNDQIVDRFGDFDVRGMATGLILQGPERGQVNRFVIHDYMFRENPEAGGIPGYNRWLDFENDGIQVNHGNWVKPRADQLEDFWLERDYNWENNESIANPVYGWFMEPFKLATSFLGLDDNVDCQFEWEINFALTPLMKRLLKDKYMTINLAAETLIPGGAASSQVTHLKVYKDLFGRRRVDGSLVNSDHEIGYYTFRFNAMNGFGNSEKLYIWSDGCIAIRSLKLMATPQSEKRASPLVTRIDVSDMEEL